MPGWKLFISKPSEFCRRTLRRYSSGSNCTSSKLSYHNAEVVIDAQIRATKEEEGGFLRDSYKDDPRWPKKCACGYEFTSGDEWQVNVHRLYQAPSGLYILRELPPGAMWEAPWLGASNSRWAGPDGKAWCVSFPGGVEWVVYGPSSDGKPWKVEGTPPNITVHPSIGLTGVYHGFIKNGVIGEDVDGRKFPGVPRTA